MHADNPGHHLNARILVTGAGGPGAVNLTRSLIAAPEPVFTVGTEASEYYIHLALTNERLLVPRCSDEEAYISTITDICKKFEINLIIPNSSIEMMVLTRNQARLPAPMRVPQLQTQELAASKWLTWNKWKEAGIPVPDTILIETRQDVEKAFDTIKSKPVWFRGAGIPGLGIGGSALPCTKPEEAYGWIEFNKGWGGFIASEFLPGDNLTFLGLFDRGRLMASQGRKRDAYVIPHVSPSGITGAPAISHTISRDDINELGVRCILEADPVFDGVAFVDFKCDVDGRPRPTEINAGRFGTTNYFYSAAGFNFPWLLVQVAFGTAKQDLSRLYNVLPDDIYWVRTLDAGPALLHRSNNKLVPWVPSKHVRV